MDSFDVAVIGGGIVGCATAYAFTQRSQAALVVIEAEDRLAAHQTGNNSGVIHSGLYYRPGSLKAQNCVRGRMALEAFCTHHDVPFERCGKLVVATCEAQLGALDELERRGRANGLDGITRVGADEIREVEPHVRGIAGLRVPETGIVDFVRMAEVLGEQVRAAGAEVRTGTRLRGLRRDGEHFVLETTRGELRCRYLVGCAGLQSDRVARRCGVEPGVRIVPFRGEYYEIVPERWNLVNHLIYPVPDPRFPFLGVHFTRMVRGGVEAGPNAVLALKREGYRHGAFSLRDVASFASYPGFWRMASRYWRTAMGEVWRSWSKRAFVRALQGLVPEIESADLRRGGAGVRAQALAPDGKLLDDFHIARGERQVHVLNAPSPAATASLAIGETIAAEAAEDFGL